MAKNTDINQPALTPEMEMVVRSLAALLNQNQAVPSPANNQVMENINGFLLDVKAEREAKIAKEVEEKRLNEESRKQNALALHQKHQMELAKQNMCIHRKPSGVTNLAGQRGHSGVTHYLCQECQKYWTGETVPQHLKPDAQFVGGPING